MMPGEFYDWLNDTSPWALNVWIMAEEWKWWVVGAVFLNLVGIWLWVIWRRKRISSSGRGCLRY